MDEIREILSELPAGFGRDPFFGLGLNFDLRFLTDAIEKLDGVTDLRLRRGDRAGLPAVSGNSYALSYRMFDEARRAVRRAHDKALDVATGEKRAYAHNTLLTALDPQRFPAQAPPYRKAVARHARKEIKGGCVAGIFSRQLIPASACLQSPGDALRGSGLGRGLEVQWSWWKNK